MLLLLIYFYIITKYMKTIKDKVQFVKRDITVYIIINNNYRIFRIDKIIRQAIRSKNKRSNRIWSKN